jgi:hypothetical protein
MVTKRKSRDIPMVLVTWVDAAFSTTSHWQDGDKPAPPKKKGLHLCASMGFLVHQDEEWVQLVTTLTDGAHAHVTEIPASMVKTISLLTSSGPLESS